MKRRIFISAGHSNTPGRDQGAPGHGKTEGQYAAELRAGVVRELKALGITANVDKDNSVTKETVSLFRQYAAGPDIMLDIHFDSSANADATGSTGVIPANYSTFEKSFATELAMIASTTLSIRNRGVITEGQTARKKLLWMTVPCENILWEVCFVSNPNDIKRYEINKQLLEKRVAEAIARYLKK